jgi:hypothetical protein
MNKTLAGWEHLIRLAVVAAALVLMFFGLRAALVPRDFGRYGHYRAASLDEIAARTPVYAGREACAACHDEIVTQKKGGKHANVGCEACHNAAANHAEDPIGIQPFKPDTAKLCPICHEADSAKPKWFPQVVTTEHAQGLACGICHNPHQPKP